MIKFDAKVSATYIVDPFLRNVHPQHNNGRRVTRATTFLQIKSLVDAAHYGYNDKFAAFAVKDRSELLSAASVRTNMVDVAEQVAIAIAMLDPKRSIIYTDCHVAVRAFASDLVAK